MRNIHLHAWLITVLLLFAVTAAPAERDEGEVVLVGEHDPEMIAAIKKARGVIG